MRRRKKNKSQSELDKFRKAVEVLHEFETQQEADAFRDAVQRWRTGYKRQVTTGRRLSARPARPSNTGWATTLPGWAMSSPRPTTGYSMNVVVPNANVSPSATAQFNPRPEVRKDIAASPIVGYRYWQVGFGPNLATVHPARSASIYHGAPHGISGVVTTNTTSISATVGGGPMYPPYARPDMGFLIRSIFQLADELERGVPLAEALRNLVPVNLLSANGVPWEPGARAVCPPAFPLHEHLPDPYCTCGYWALQDEAHVHARFNMNDLAQQLPCAVGSVELYGRVIEHERGWRGEYARPRDLHFYRVDERVAEQIAKRYGCNVLSVTP